MYFLLCSVMLSYYHCKRNIVGIEIITGNVRKSNDFFVVLELLPWRMGLEND